MSAVNSSNANIQPGREGVITLSGYGIHVGVDRGHLSLEDGIGAERRTSRLPRVGHGLRRLVVIGSDGMVSLAALRWLADQDAAFIMLERSGKVLVTTGPVSSSDAKLRRAQALANESGAALRITRELITRKLAAQEDVARHKLLLSAVPEAIAGFREEVATADSIATIAILESQGAAAYWSAWHNLPVNFPKNDLHRVPQHWRVFGTRNSPLTGSSRLAANPANAILNYLYAVLESETRLAVAALGLDPGLGVLHVDTANRDSLACDVLEPIRPQVDTYLLNWITRQPLRREWFFEQRDGNCRLMAPLTERLSETAPTWRRAVAPIAEWVALAFRLTIRKPDRRPSTPLTQTNKRKAQANVGLAPANAPRPENFCHECGKPVAKGSGLCATCIVPVSRDRMLEIAKRGRIASKSAESRNKLASTQRRQAAGRYGWLPSNQPQWLTEETYKAEIKPLLRDLSVSQIANALEVSRPYAASIRVGRREAHPRHWLTLARMAKVV